jgi:Protein of unknown function (DUF2752)
VAEKNSLSKVLIVITTLLLLVVLYFFADARNSTIFPRCIFHTLTGLYCPGCGSQRAFSSLLHGDVWQALGYNLLFILCLPLLCYSGVVTVINVFRKEQIVQQIFYSTFFVRMVFVVIIIFWIARNLSFYPMNLLAPHPIN